MASPFDGDEPDDRDPNGRPVAGVQMRRRINPPVIDPPGPEEVEAIQVAQSERGEAEDELPARSALNDRERQARAAERIERASRAADQLGRMVIREEDGTFRLSTTILLGDLLADRSCWSLRMVRFQWDDYDVCIPFRLIVRLASVHKGRKLPLRGAWVSREGLEIRWGAAGRLRFIPQTPEILVPITTVRIVGSNRLEPTSTIRALTSGC